MFSLTKILLVSFLLSFGTAFANNSEKAKVEESDRYLHSLDIENVAGSFDLKGFFHFEKNKGSNIFVPKYFQNEKHVVTDNDGVLLGNDFPKRGTINKLTLKVGKVDFPSFIKILYNSEI